MSDVPSPEVLNWASSFTGIPIASADGTAAPGGPKGKPQTKAKEPEKKPPEPDLTDQAIEKIIGDPQKKLLEMAKRKIPTYSDQYKTDTPRTQFLDDMETGTKKAGEYIEYMSKAAEYAQKYGKSIDGIAQAAGQLKGIASKLKSGLGKAGKVISNAKQLSGWIDAVGDFADVSASMDPRDRKSVEHWVGSMRHLWDKTTPFIDWLKDKGTEAALLEGSEAGAALSATLSIVAAQLYIGGEVLKVGVQNVNAYLKRYDDIMKEIDRQSGNAPPEPPPEPEPQAPTPWMSREEKAESAKQMEDSDLRDSMRNERYQKEMAVARAHQQVIRQATDEFESKMFLRLYQSHRAGIRAHVLAALRKASGGGSSPPSKWWDCFVADDAEVLKRANAPNSSDDLADDPGFDQEAGIFIDPTKTRVSNEEAAFEIENFTHVSPPCPFFRDLHDGELKKYVAAAVAKAEQP